MIHFFTIGEFSSDGKTAFLTLPGQRLGRQPVSPDTLVRPAKGAEALFRKMKQTYPKGTPFFTRSLKRKSGFYTAGDITPLVRTETEDTLDFAGGERALWEQWKTANGKE